MISFKELVEAGVHFGHHTSKWHPKMRPYLWGTRSKVHLINVAKTAFLLNRAEKFLTDAAAQGKPVLWVGTKRPAQKAVREAANKLNMPYVTHRWIGGTLSNFDQVRKAFVRLMHMRDAKDKSLDTYSKKEQSMFMKEMERLEKNFGGIIDLKQLPAAIVVVDAKRESSAIKEALVMGIPVISIVDTNTDPTGITFVIPSNDDSPKAIDLLVNRLADATAAGVEKAAVAAEAAKKAAAEEKEAALKAKEAAKKEAKPKAAAKADKVEAKPAAKAADKAVAKEEKVAAKPAAKKPAAKKAAPKEVEAKAEEKAEKTEAKPAAKKAAAPKKAAAKKPAAKAAAKPAAAKDEK
ncbi:MAG: 30S ribosomal protein S2 [Candidatus Dependentiae bacterium]|jgi:small subunit ribosomal protein S2